MAIRLELRVYAPIPVGHRVTVLFLERYLKHLLGSGGEWAKSDHVLVCDETTRVIYADQAGGLDEASTYEKLLFVNDAVRISTIEPAVRGTVASCLALSDNGDTVRFKTVLGIDHG